MSDRIDEILNEAREKFDDLRLEMKDIFNRLDAQHELMLLEVYPNIAFDLGKKHAQEKCGAVLPFRFSRKLIYDYSTAYNNEVKRKI